MAARIAWRASSACSLRRISPGPRRAYSTGKDAIAFTIELETQPKDLHALLASVKQQITLANNNCHDAAVLLTTPQYARWIEDEAFMSDFVGFISDSQKANRFHVLSAVVDHVAPSIPRNRPVNGLSVLRGRLEDILPSLWRPAPTKTKEDADKVAALTFNLGNPQLTVPLANTTFQNHRTSTLFASRFDLGREGPSLAERIEKHWQQINPPLSKPAKSVKDLGLWAPLVPLTRSRVVTESFGNIVRRISVDDDSAPASIELEPAVDELFRKGSSLARSPMGIWAVITPPAFSPNGVSSAHASDPDPGAVFDEKNDIRALTASTSSYLQALYGRGGRLYQILSGGGGWGAKKGLLSLDPQRTHFALSEEEEMQRFMEAMDGGNFVPVGSRIQFFASPEADADDSIESRSSGFVFGTTGTIKPPSSATSGEALVLNDHFGALSNDGVFAASSEHDAMEPTPGFNNEWKLNVPHSRIFVGKQ